MNGFTPGHQFMFSVCVCVLVTACVCVCVFINNREEARYGSLFILFGYF